MKRELSDLPGLTHKVSQWTGVRPFATSVGSDLPRGELLKQNEELADESLDCRLKFRPVNYEPMIDSAAATAI